MEITILNRNASDVVRPSQSTRMRPTDLFPASPGNPEECRQMGTTAPIYPDASRLSWNGKSIADARPKQGNILFSATFFTCMHVCVSFLSAILCCVSHVLHSYVFLCTWYVYIFDIIIITRIVCICMNPKFKVKRQVKKFSLHLDN